MKKILSLFLFINCTFLWANVDYCDDLNEELREFYQLSQDSYLNANLIWLNDGDKLMKAAKQVYEQKSCDDNWAQIQWRNAGKLYLKLLQAESDSEAARDSLSEIKINCSGLVDDEMLKMENNLETIYQYSRDLLSENYQPTSPNSGKFNLSTLSVFCGFWPVYE